MSELRITFTDRPNVYQPGCTVNGSVELYLAETIKYCGVVFQAIGEVYTNFQKTSVIRYNDYKGRQKHAKDDLHFKGYLCYLDDKQYLRFPDEKEEFLFPGTHYLRFSFILPDHCPTSFEGSYGYIRYWCTAKVDGSFHEPFISKMAFTVMPTYDLNSVPESVKCIKSEATSENNLALLQRGPVNMKVLLPKAGFVPGETLHLCAKIENESNDSIVNIKLQFQQISTYSGYSTSTDKLGSVVEERICNKNKQSVHIRSKQTKTVFLTLDIPATPPSFGDCPFIEVRYRLDVKIFSNGYFHRPLMASLPILIGTIPVSAPRHKIFTDSAVGCSLDNEVVLDENNDNTDCCSDSCGNSRDIIPTYKACAYAKPIVGPDKLFGYVPLYPFYNNIQQYSEALLRKCLSRLEIKS